MISAILKRYSRMLDMHVAMGIMTTVGLMLLLTLAGIGYMSQVNSRMREVVAVNNVKIELTQEMLSALRERSINLYVMASSRDVFLKDKEYQRFIMFGTQYLVARQRLESMLVTDEEKAIMQQVTSQSRDAMAYLRDVMEKLQQAGASRQFDVIHNTLMPRQKIIYDEVVKLGRLQKAQAEEAAHEVEATYRNARLLLLATGILASVLATLIAFVVSRKVAQQAHELEHQAFHDNLTGLANRALFMDRLGHAISRAGRGGAAFAVILLDIDRFKDVNDTLGHNMGDQLLQEAARRLGGELRETDTVARLGGDEFVVLLENMDVQYAPYVAEKLGRVLEQPFALGGQVVDVSGSFGIACYPEHGDSGVTLLKRADVAMYAAKRSHAGIAVYTGNYERNTRIELNFRSELLRAMERDELVLHFQPKIDLRTGIVCSLEALVRWQHPQRGFIPPDQFIPMTEKAGLIDKLTLWVLRKALEMCVRLQEQGMPVTVAVNLSARSLHDLRLPGEIKRWLDKYLIAPSMLVLEITEGAVMSDPDAALEVLQILDRMGVALSIDDFGVGYSSLSYLARLPVDEIKIDKSFVLEMMREQQAATIVRSTIELGHNLGMKVVAEGVETRQILDLLTAHGCDTAQGYLMSKPLPIESLMNWLRESEWGLR